MKRGIAIYGAGGFGKEVRGMIGDAFAGYIDDGFTPDPKADVDNIDDILVAVALTKNRKAIVERLKGSLYRFESFIHPSVELHRSVSIRRGSIICAGVRLTVDISIGEFVIVNLNATIGHDVHLGDFVSIMPGVNISGNVKVGDNVFIGSGATILQGLTIGEGATIGAGAVVTKNVAPGITVVGVPARTLKK